jgi:hypothetical protein
MKVITAYNKQHEQYLESCQRSVRCKHDIQFDWGHGKAWAMNRLLERVDVNGTIVVLDADDTLNWNIIERNIALLDKYDVVYGDVVNFSMDGKEIYHSMPFCPKTFKKKNFIPFSGTVINGWLAKFEPYPDIFHGNDWLWWHLLLQHSSRFHYEPGIVANRRTWTSYKRCNLPVLRKIKRKYYDFKVRQKINEIY